MRQARFATNEQHAAAPVNNHWPPSENATRTRGEFILGLLFFFFVIYCLWLTGKEIERRFFTEDNIPVSALVVQGSLEYVTTDEIKQLLLKDKQIDNFFTLDVNNLQKQVELLPWVNQVSVRKRWPALLYVYVSEQTPCALWGDDRLLSTRGVIFKAPRERLKKPLVQLSGPDDMAQKVWDQYQQFDRILALNSYQIAAVHLTNRRAWELQLSTGQILKLGREQMLVKLQQFIDVFPKLENKEQIDYLDLRYDTGVAVKWKQQVEGSGNDQNPRQKSDSRT